MYPNIPTGEKHLASLEWLRKTTHDKTSMNLAGHAKLLDLIAVSLVVLYEASTCHRKCHGGPHVLESLCGRTYNLGAAALQLTNSGYYDEALSLMRSIGEISNLISLSVVDKQAIQSWLTLDEKGRIARFSPSAVRKMIEAQPGGKNLMYADRDWYSRFCETYTHVTPHTKPNAHDPGSKVGGLFQASGLESCLQELSSVLGFVALIVCRYFRFEDRMSEFGKMLAAPEGTNDTVGQ